MQKKEAKKQIATLAKKYEVPSQVLVDLLIDKGFDVKSERSLITSKNFAEIRLKVIEKQQEMKDKQDDGLKAKIIKKKSKPIKIVNTNPVKINAESEVKVEKEAVQEGFAQELEEIDAKVKDTVASLEGSTEVLETKEFLVEKSQITEKEKPASIITEKITQSSSVIEKPIIKNSPRSTLKVQVDKKQDQALLDRIQKHQEQKKNASLQRNARKGQGYSGRFGNKPNDANSGSLGQDVYSRRAQDAGVTLSSIMQGGKTGDSQRGDNRLGSRVNKGKAGKDRYKKNTPVSKDGNKGSVDRSRMSRFLENTTKIGKKSYKKVKKETVDDSLERKVLEVAEFISIAELAGLLNVSSNTVIAKCLEMGMMVTINQRLDMDTISIIADDFNVDVKALDEYQEESYEDDDQDDKEDLELRAPIVTIMGHVDHGKTSVLDRIRNSKVTQGETGGITQHIGAYSVKTSVGNVTFLDTPGHEAFAAMRSRGAQVTDLIVLVVAADSVVMPQTREAIEHARSAKVKLIVAINKCDLETANPDMVKAKLAEEGVLVDSYGGDVSCVEISAKRGDNIDKLLEMLALEAEVMELKANSKREFARATVIETRLDKGKGIVSTIIIQNGTLRVGDIFVCGPYSGKVRAILNDKDEKIEKALPAMPVQILGFSGASQSGDVFMVVSTEQKARDLVSRRIEASQERERRQKQRVTLEQFHEQIVKGEFHELNLIVKADVDGSVEAIANSLDKLSTDEVRVNIISKGVGAVKEADIHLAVASDAMIISFHLLPTKKMRSTAESSGVSIQYYNTIYQVTESIQGAMEGMLNPELIEEVCGEANVLQIFKVPKVGIIAGCVVAGGFVDRDSLVRLYRERVLISEAKVTSLKRIKDDVKVVKNGLECGIGISGVSNIQEGDTLAFFKKKEVARQLKVPNQDKVKK